MTDSKLWLHRDRNVTALVVGCFGVLAYALIVAVAIALLFYGLRWATHTEAASPPIVTCETKDETIRAQRDTIIALRECYATEATVCPGAF